MTAEATTATALHLEDVHASYGAVKALHGVSLDVRQGSVVTLLGANGAGKTTTLRVISGQLAPTAGAVDYKGETVIGRSPGQLVRRGIVHVPEGRQIIGDLTVEENLRVGGYSRSQRDEVKRDIEEMFTLFPRLGERRRQRSGRLSGGEQQMLAIARGLMGAPRLLLLDEPSLGLAPMIVQDIFRVLGEINKAMGVTILLVEQNASIALRIADYAYVMETGSIVIHGTGDELRKDEAVRRSYLGY